MSSYRDSVFDALAGLERRHGCPLAFLQEVEDAKAEEVKEKKSGKTGGTYAAWSKKS